MFLAGDGCDYRLKHGCETLPVSCVKFPYLGLLTPKRRLYGLSFTCPTALELFARRKELELRDHVGPPPTSAACDFLGPEPADERSQAAAFWDLQWAWLRFLRAADGSPAMRLKALAEQAAGLDLPVVELGTDFWSLPQWDRSAGKALMRAGGLEAVLQEVYEDERNLGATVATEPALGDDEDALLGLYLEHRLLAPEFLMTGASLARLLGALFAAVARFRIEKARGSTALDAIANLDRLLLHSDYLPQLFAAHVEEAKVWPSLALLALAR